MVFYLSYMYRSFMNFWLKLYVNQPVYFDIEIISLAIPYFQMVMEFKFNLSLCNIDNIYSFVNN